MAQTSPKREAALKQVEELRKAGMKDTDIADYLKQYGLTKEQVMDLFPMTKAKSEPAPPANPKPQGVSQQTLDELTDFLRSLPRRLGGVDGMREAGLVAKDAVKWAEKLGGK